MPFLQLICIAHETVAMDLGMGQIVPLENVKHISGCVAGSLITAMQYDDPIHGFGHWQQIVQELMLIRGAPVVSPSVVQAYLSNGHIIPH